MEIILNTVDSDSIYIHRSIGFLVDRLYNKIYSRPLIAHLKSKEELKEFISKHLFERSQYYLRSKKILKTDNSELDQVIQELIGVLG